MGSQRTFATLATSDGYRSAAALLLESLAIRDRSVTGTCIGCLGWSDAQIGAFREKFPGIECIRLAPPEQPIAKETAIRWKPALLRRILAGSAENAVVVYCDADLLVLRDLSPLFESMKNHDIGLRYRPEHVEETMEYAAGVVCVRNSGPGRAAVAEWERLVGAAPSGWYADQSALPKLARYCESIGAKVWRMNGRVSSMNSGSLKSLIWSKPRWRLTFAERIEANRAIFAMMHAPGGAIPELQRLQSAPTTRLQLVAGDAARKRSRISADDLHFLSLAPFLLLTALFVPERHWPRATRRIQRLADALRPPPAMRDMERLAAPMGVDAATLSRWIADSRIGRMQHLIHNVRSALGKSWRPRTELVGKEHIDAALERGKGAVLWVSHFCYSSLFTKMALAGAGCRVSHVSRPEHGVSKSRFGIAFLNSVRRIPEDRFLAARIVHDRARPPATKQRVMRALSNNELVSVTVGAWEGRRVAIGPLHGGEYKVALGAPNFAFESGAPLLPAFTFRMPNGIYRTIVGAPLGESARDSREGFLLAASEELLYEHGPMILAHPGQWRGWKDWIEQSRRGRPGGPGGDGAAGPVEIERRA